MDVHGFRTCATLRFSSKARLLPSSWCPDKDLVLVITNVAGRDKLSLWPREGARRMWEIEPNTDASDGTEIAAVAWSPDGLEIAVAHNPPAITLHSIQNGQQSRTLSIPTPASGNSLRLTSISWFAEHRPKKKPDIPDIFKRQGDITGSAHSILKSQPLLDVLHDDSQPLSSSELFAFQGSHGRPASRQTTPSVISTWPTLPPDFTAASFQSPSAASQQQRPGEELDEVDDSNLNSILAATDDLGNIYPFLDGSCPLGTVNTGWESSIMSLYKASNVKYFAHPAVGPSKGSPTQIPPLIIDIPLLKTRIPRDVARVSTSARELTWYALRVIKEMRATWFSSETHQGAREAGPKWLRALEQRQRQKFGIDDPNAILDLTVLLATCRASEALADFLGSGEQMSERSIQKWESSVTEALTKLRDYATQRVAPACQRLHILLQEVLGWSQLSEYHECKLRTSEIEHCLDLAGRAIVCANWLAATARKELARFREFISWLRWAREVSSGAGSSDAHKQSGRHDLLEVNEYMMSGLVVSPIDKWFMGPVPTFMPADLGAPQAENLASSVQKVRQMLSKPEGLPWPPPARHQDLSRLDRNLDSLIQDLCTRCHSIFNEASKASARSALISSRLGIQPDRIREASDANLLVRERTVDEVDESNCFTQHLAFKMPRGDGENFLLLVKLHHDKEMYRPERPVSVAVLQCAAVVGPQQGMVPVDVLEAEFFDENILMIVYRPRQREHGPTSIATLSYTDLAYEDITTIGAVHTREEVMEGIEQRLKDGQTISVPLRLIQSRPLIGCREGGVTLAVNGRAGRRVACVLDDGGVTLEIMDIEPPEEEEEEEEEESEDMGDA